MKATFFDRLLAYLTDFLIIGVILSLVTFKMPTFSKDYNKQLETVTNKFLSEEISSEEYMDSYSTILYDSQKDNKLQTEILAILMIGYFIVFQYLNKGQTLGKKLMKIRVVDKSTKKPINLIRGGVRSLFILNILSTVIGLVCLYLTDKNTYLYTYATLAGIESLFIFITIFFVLYRKDGRGLHDMMASSIVIKEKNMKGSE